MCKFGQVQKINWYGCIVTAYAIADGKKEKEVGTANIGKRKTVACKYKRKRVEKV